MHDPDDLDPDDRLKEVAHILAIGVLRLHSRSALVVGTDAENLPENPSNGLELPPDPRLSVSRRVDEF